jgi:hypothetical protein
VAQPKAEAKAKAPAQTLKLISKGFFSWDYSVFLEGREIAMLDRDFFNERAVFRLQGVPYEARRTSVLKGTFELLQGRSVLAEARRPSVFSHRFELTAGTERYEVAKASLFSRHYRLLQDGQVLGDIRRDGFLTRGATASLPEAMSSPVALFVVFLVTTLWKRQAQSSS